MERPLTRREREMLTALVEHAEDELGHGSVTPAEREAWRVQAAHTSADGRCGCGTCPSIDLVVTHGGPPPESRATGPYRVLSAGHPDCVILLHIRQGLLRQLECAPISETVSLDSFPPAEELRMG